MINHLLVAAMLQLSLLGGFSVRGQTTEAPAATVHLPPPKPAPEFTVQSCSVTSQSVTMNCGGNCASDARVPELERKMDHLMATVSRLMATVSDCCNDTDTNTRPKDCKEILDNSELTPSGVYMVYPADNLGGFPVYCDMHTDGGGWTVFQKRQDGTVDFYRGWADYKTGFPSNLNGEFWLGNDKLHRLTEQKAYGLRVDLEDTTGNTAYAAYSSFSISDESDQYRLTVGGYSGDAGDSMAFQNGQRFSTKDSDNDAIAAHCSQRYKGAWWYGDCHNANLNGLYHLGAHSTYADGVNWNHWKGYYYSLKRTTMKIRPV
ncbi:PREDICTED: microfibril-associated glycoprotein 4-like isoform X2 [Branchiostoma belcheri]|uniref:Microfibril-associated glycoprotein 4-like isoform X2 n=1 Tax=Branchiostoma belcheri TaxID=7741 RepID=A0A6P4Z6I5_BRABE|nr:PREDICTED: microfibril-associated glycoprotein 4-like isoform X2 [Branchiostoma belcheri]